MIVESVSEKLGARLQITAAKQKLLTVFDEKQLGGLEVMSEQIHLLKFIKNRFDLSTFEDHG